MNRSLGAGDLLGIALVVDDIHKGCNLAFRYPAPLVSAAQDHVSSFHKLSAPLIAKLFRPKNALCNESFELVIDDLRFVSHPVLVPRRVSSSSAAAAPGSAVGSLPTPPTGTLMTAPAQLPTAPLASTATTANASAAVRESDTTMFNIIFVLDEHRQQPFQLRQAADTIGDESASGSDGSATGGCDNQAQLQQHKQRIAAFRTIAAQLANGLLHEELRAGFVSREVRELLHIRDELLQYERTLAASSGSSGNGSSTNTTGASGGGGNNQSGGSGGGGGGTSAKDGAENASHQSVLEVDPQTVIDVSLSKSVLANDLKSVFHGLEASGTVHVVINHWVKLSLTLTDAVSLKMQDFRPYQTLLLLTDEDAVLNALPADHSYQLSVLIKAASPLKTFQDLALETSIPIHQLFRLAAHLVYWGFGRVVDTITMHNFYQVRPKRSLRSTSALALEFKRTFPPRELCEVLASFNGARRLGDSVKNLGSAQKMEYIHMLIWLLQRDFIMQLHRYVYFMIPPEQDAPPERERDDPIDDEENYTFAASNREYRTRDSRSYSQASAYGGGRTIDQQLYGKSIPPVNTTSVGFSDQEKAYLDRIATTNPVFTLFRRLCVYFHGQYHLEEIMWRENVSRSELRTVLSTYQGIIVCCLHE